MTNRSRSQARAPRLLPKLALTVAILVLLVPTASIAQVESGTVVVPTGQLAAGIYPPSQWEASDHIDAVNAASGANLALSGMWLNAHEPPANIIHQLEEAWSAGATPFVNINVDWPSAQVASGLIDADIAAFGSAVGDWLAQGGGRSVLLAPMPEMNGDWVPYGMDPASFQTAYRRFRTIATQNGASGRVRWVFAPNGWSTPPHQMADYYPGADLVDFVGFSAYNWGNSQAGFIWTSAPATLCAPLNEARAFAREKPMLIAQTASSTSGGSRGPWLSAMFEFLANDPNAVGFLYFDIDKERDWAIYENGTTPTQWQEGMQSALTSYQFPLENWFAPGQLVVDTANQISLGCFADVENSQFQLEIDWLVNAGITVGCGNSRFCPTRAVTRGQMASFLVRALDLPPAASDHFGDDAGSIHQADINALAEAGITTGCNTGAYCPDGTTTRAQMATFLTRALGLGAAPTDYFSDDAELVHEQDINSVALTGITKGCGPALFCPNNTVTREQMAAFLHRTFASPAGG